MLARAGPSGTNIVTNRLGTTSKSGYPKPSTFCSEGSRQKGLYKVARQGAPTQELL